MDQEKEKEEEFDYIEFRSKGNDISPPSAFQCWEFHILKKLLLINKTHNSGKKYSLFDFDNRFDFSREYGYCFGEIKKEEFATDLSFIIDFLQMLIRSKYIGIPLNQSTIDWHEMYLKIKDSVNNHSHDLLYLHLLSKYPDLFKFELEFYPEGITRIEKAINSHVNLFISGKIPSESLTYYSHEKSFEFLQGIITEKLNIEGKDIIEIKSSAILGYKTMFDIHQKKDVQPPFVEVPILPLSPIGYPNIRIVETLCAMELQNKLEIIDIDAHTLKVVLSEDFLKELKSESTKGKKKSDVTVDRERGVISIKGKDVFSFRKSSDPWKIFIAAYDTPNKTISITNNQFEDINEKLGVINNLNKRFRQKKIPIEFEKMDKDTFKLLINA